MADHGTLSAVSRRRRTVTLILAVAFIGFGFLTERWFLHPRMDAPGRADVIFVLGGGGDRVPYALDLARSGVADEVVFASTYFPDVDYWATRPCNSRRPGGPIPAGVEIRCIETEPETTRGEARTIAQMAEDEGWRSVVVVASTDQITRARRLIGRCWDGDVRLTGPEHDQPWPMRAAYEWGATIKATFLRGC